MIKSKIVWLMVYCMAIKTATMHTEKKESKCIVSALLVIAS